MNSINQLSNEDEFQRAWTDPSNTRFELPPVDVNQVLTDYYRTSEPLSFTGTMLWDMEVRKAWRPDRYIPSVVKAETARAWGRRPVAEESEYFVRSSQQRLWLEPAEYGLVLEKVHVNPTRQKVTFIGAAELPDGNSRLLQAGAGQPLFHVEHSVGGSESQPLNQWRIVYLTDRHDDRMIERFALIAKDVWLPEFIEIYIQNELNVKLNRREFK